MTTVAELQSFSSVPKLETNGSNWIIFQIRLKWALEEKRVFSHLDGTMVKPTAAGEEDISKDVEEWLGNETKARHLLAQKLYDSTLTKLLHLTTVAEVWKTITQEFTVKSSHVVAAMRTSFESLKCANNGNIRTHLDKLRFKYEELVGIGITIPSTEYATRIIGSLPSHYQQHLSTIEASARASALATTAVQMSAASPTTMTQTTFSVSPDLLIQLAMEEYDRIQSAPGHRGPKQPKADTGVALLATKNGSGTRGGKLPQKPRLARNGKPFGTCWNCGRKGHLLKDCPSPPQGATGSLDKGKKKDEVSRPSGGSANTALSSEEDGVGSAFDPADLFDDDVSITDSVTTDSDSTTEGLFSYSRLPFQDQHVQ